MAMALQPKTKALQQDSGSISGNPDDDIRQEFTLIYLCHNHEMMKDTTKYLG